MRDNWSELQENWKLCLILNHKFHVGIKIQARQLNDNNILSWSVIVLTIKRDYVKGMPLSEPTALWGSHVQSRHWSYYYYLSVFAVMELCLFTTNSMFCSINKATIWQCVAFPKKRCRFSEDNVSLSRRQLCRFLEYNVLFSRRQRVVFQKTICELQQLWNLTLDTLINI